MSKGRETVDNLARVWDSITALGRTLGEDEWKAPTSLPGWTVQDVIAHIIGYERVLLGDTDPPHTVDASDKPYLKSPMQHGNEVAVDLRRSRAGTVVFVEFLDVSARRLEHLRALKDDDFEAKTMTPVGEGTVVQLLELRLMDSWVHEQDMRVALNKPGHLEGPEVAQVLRYFAGFLPYIVGKRAGAPEGTMVYVEVDGSAGFKQRIEVVDGRAKAVHGGADGTNVQIALDISTYVALANGRRTAHGVRAAVEGDLELGQRILEGMNTMV
jgi:uncharacterized protein (TIGR03083 family)